MNANVLRIGTRGALARMGSELIRLLDQNWKCPTVHALGISSAPPISGDTFAGRVAASLLHAVGLPELVTHSLVDYEALALDLARDSGRLARLKTKLAANRTTHPLFDTGLFTGNLESAYIRMWQHHRAGLPPQSFE